MPSNNQDAASSLERAVAGAAGAVLANALVYPLDIVKTRLQVQTGPAHKLKETVNSIPDDNPEATQTISSYGSTREALLHIVANDGIDGLYVGLLGSLIGTASTNFAYFYWYSVFRALYENSKLFTAPSTTTELSLGAIAGAAAQVCTLPISVVTTRQQTSDASCRKGFVGTVQDIVDTDDGITGLWRGLKASLVLVVNPAITYGTYERLKRLLFPGKLHLKPAQAFVLGALSKSLATVVTHPLIVAKVRLQSTPPSFRSGVAFSSFTEVLRFTWQHEGIRGLFKGIKPQIVKGLLVQGILMMSKERVEIFLRLLLKTFKASSLLRWVAYYHGRNSLKFNQLVGLKSS